MLVQLLGGRRTQRADRHGSCLHRGHQPRERQPPDRPRVARGMPIRHVGTLARCVFLSTLMLGVCRESRAQRPGTTSPMYRKAPLCRRAAVLTSTRKIRSGWRATPVSYSITVAVSGPAGRVASPEVGESGVFCHFSHFAHQIIIHSSLHPCTMKIASRPF